MTLFEQQKQALYRKASVLAKHRELSGIVYYDTDQHLPSAAVERRGELIGYLAEQHQQVFLDAEMKEMLDFFRDENYDHYRLYWLGGDWYHDYSIAR